MTIVQKVQDSEFCNTCCNGTVILVLQLIAEIEERQAGEGYLSRPIRIWNHIWLWTEECWSNELSDHRDLSVS